MKRAVSASITIILAFSLFAACNILIVRGSGTVYIRADGSIEPATAPVSTFDNIYDTIVVDARACDVLACFR